MHRDHDLGAHAVDAGNQQGFTRGGLVKATKSAHLTLDPRIPGGANGDLGARQSPGGGVDVDPAVGVLHGFLTVV